MHKKNSHNAAFTLLEVLLASIIFVLTIGGLFVTLNAVRAPVTSKENSLVAAITGKQALESLRSQVNAATYYNGCSILPLDASNNCTALDLSLGPHLVPQAKLPVGISWPAVLQNLNPNGLNYSVNCADGTPGNGNAGNNTTATATCSNTCTLNCNLDQARQVTVNITSS